MASPITYSPQQGFCSEATSTSVTEETSLFFNSYNSQHSQSGYYSLPSNRYPISSPQPIAPQPVMPVVTGSPGYPTAAAPSNSSMLLSLRMPYSSQDYSFTNFSNTEFMPSTFDYAAPLGSSFSSTCSPSSPNHDMPMWSPYPFLPTIPSTRMSPHHCHYKLIQERAIPLIKWFEKHKEHPYPTRHEKILLCQSTQLTFTQVSTWFANARRRMKKANSSEDEDNNSASSSERENSTDCNSSNIIL